MYLTSDIKLLSEHSLPVNIKPSDRIYYDEYPYKVTLEGSHIYHDIEQHYIISDWVDRNIAYPNLRHTWNKSGRHFYLRYFEDVQALVEEFKWHVVNVRGPYNEQHRNVLTRKFKGHFSPVYRDKYFYSKYSVKICISKTTSYRNINTNTESLFMDIDKFVAAQCKNYKWYENPKFSKQWVNYLYLLEEDRDIVLQVLLLNFKQFIREKEEVFIYSKLL